VNAVRSEIELVFLNLCMNAIQAQPKGGALRVRVHRVVTESGDALVEASVADAGPGIAVENRERIFEAFFTTKPPSEGTGLGLAICEEIVRRQGGTIVATDGPEGGALFRVSLPEA
jgi:two-component system NtrC family sensor kinase